MLCGEGLTFTVQTFRLSSSAYAASGLRNRIGSLSSWPQRARKDVPEFTSTYEYGGERPSGFSIWYEPPGAVFVCAKRRKPVVKQSRPTTCTSSPGTPLEIWPYHTRTSTLFALRY